MSVKLKITLGILLLIAGFLVVRLGLFFKHSAQMATTANISSQGARVSDENWAAKDSDNDGIPNVNEAYYRTDPSNPDTDGDGYLDGIEASEGCNPTIPSPNDCGAQGKVPKNVTEHFGSLILGGLLSNDLKKDNPASSSYLSLLIDDTLKTKEILLSVDYADSKKVTGLNAQMPQEYLNAIESALKKYFFVKKYENLDAIDSEDFDFSPYVENLNQLYGELIQITPPQDWEQTHKNLLGFTQKLKKYFSNLNEQKQDPLKALITISSTDSLLSEYEKTFKEIANKVKNENLKTKIFAHE